MGERECGTAADCSTLHSLCCNALYFSAGYCRMLSGMQEHPANQTVARLLQTGAVGQLTQLDAQVLIPAYLFNKDDIRFKARLAGG